MIYPIIFYTVKCDHCNLEWIDNDESEWGAMIEESQMLDMLMDEDWHVTEDGKHYCFDCWQWDGEGDLELDSDRLNLHEEKYIKFKDFVNGTFDAGVEAASKFVNEWDDNSYDDKCRHMEQEKAEIWKEINKITS